MQNSLSKHSPSRTRIFIENRVVEANVSQLESSISKPSEEVEESDYIPIRMCPICKGPVQSEYYTSLSTHCCALFLCLGLACWVPYVVDGCQSRKMYCETCQKETGRVELYCFCF